jgi:NAD-dependent dihydropyrimidine dehydrogenase PreA subunit
MRSEGIFIAVEVDDSLAGDPELARRLTEACPVDIFAQGDGGSLELVESNLDECVLCRLCLDAVGGDPPPLKVIKIYDGGAVLA